jgi:hypothetical protein
VRWKEGLLFGGRGRQADAGDGRGGAGDGKEGERAQHGNTEEEEGNGFERTRGLSGLTHFGPKSETGTGARGRVRTALSIWVAPLGRVFCPRGRVRTRDGRLRRSNEDALMISSHEDLVSITSLGLVLFDSWVIIIQCIQI